MQKIALFTTLGLLSLVALLSYDYFRFFDKRLHMTFCDVGQGDAIFVRTPGGKNILIDAGPDTSVLSCLSDHLPFWERNIDLMILSHPHDDHFAGMHYLIERYNIKSFATENLHNPTIGFEGLKEKISGKKIPTRHVLSGDRFQLEDGVVIEVLGPTRDYLNKTSPGGTIGERAEFASVILKVSYGSFSAILPGDSQKEGLMQVSQSAFHNSTILQVPHHGSRSGLDKNTIRFISPNEAIISVGKNNYGHPSKEILELLKNEHINVLRTDERGDIEIVSDGKGWGIKK